MGESNYWNRALRRRVSRRAMARGSALAAASFGLTLAGCGGSTSNSSKPPASATSATAGSGVAPAAAAPRTPGGAPVAGGSPAASVTASALGKGVAKGVELRGIQYYRNAPDFTLTPKAGGKVTSMYNGVVPHLDPATTTSTVMHAAVTPVYNRLVRDGYASERKQLDPWNFYPTGDLAGSWEVPGDGTQYTFKLRPGVKWQNVAPVNGRAFTAQDVVYSLQRYKTKGLLTGEFQLADQITVPDDQTVVIKLTQPFPDFLTSPLGKNQCLMLPHEIADADGDFQKRAIGTGPFVMTNFDKTTRVDYKKNPDYWDKDANGQQLPYLDEYHLLVGDAAIQRNGFLSGQVDLTFDALNTQADIDSLVSKKADAIVYNWQADVNTYNIAPQLKTAPFNDVRVRRALSLAIDWEGINKALFNGEADTSTMFMPWSYIFDKKPARKDLGPWYAFDPNQAKQLLKDAGAGNGLKVKIEYNEYQPYLTRMLEIIQQQIAPVGFQLDIQKVEYTTFFDKWSKKSWDSLTLGFVPASAQTMNAWTYDSLHSGSPSNYWDVNDPKVDTLVEQQRSELDPAKRKASWKQIWDTELDQIWRIPTIQTAGWFYAPSNIHNIMAPTRYHNYWIYGGAELATTWHS